RVAKAYALQQELRAQVEALGRGFEERDRRLAAQVSGAIETAAKAAEILPGLAAKRLGGHGYAGGGGPGGPGMAPGATGLDHLVRGSAAHHVGLPPAGEPGPVRRDSLARLPLGAESCARRCAIRRVRAGHLGGYPAAAVLAEPGHPAAAAGDNDLF